MRQALVALALLAACTVQEPRFKVGDKVQFKGLPTYGVVTIAQKKSLLGPPIVYEIRLPSGVQTYAYEVELEPTK